MVLDEPCDAVRLAAFFVGGEGEDDVAIRLVAFLLHPNHGGHQNRVAVLYVLRTTAVEVAVLLEEFKRVDGPIFAPRFDYIEMADDKNRFARAGTVKPDDEISFSGIRAAEEDVALGVACVAQAFGHRFGRDGGVADGIG